MNNQLNRWSVEYPLHIVLPFIIPSWSPIIYAAVYQTLTKYWDFSIVADSFWVESLL